LPKFIAGSLPLAIIITIYLQWIGLASVNKSPESHALDDDRLEIGIGVLQWAGVISDSRLSSITFEGLERSIYH